MLYGWMVDATIAQNHDGTIDAGCSARELRVLMWVYRSRLSGVLRADQGAEHVIAVADEARPSACWRTKLEN